jgi:hypothetical protein
MGPCEVLKKAHKDTYLVQTATTTRLVVSEDIRIFLDLGGKTTPLHYFRPRAAIASEEEAEETHVVERVINHRGKGRSLQFRVRWRGCLAASDTWEPLSSFPGFESQHSDLAKYVKGRKIPLVLDHIVGAVSIASPLPLSRPPSAGGVTDYLRRGFHFLNGTEPTL